MKILNAYAGIGGNRKLWGGHDIVAVEKDPDVAAIYRDHFPEDEVVVGDAHAYIRENFQEFDFIWSSPPCPTHSQVRNVANVGRGQSAPVFPDMTLYEEVIFLQEAERRGWRDWQGEFVVENVRAYYDPLIEPQEIGRHWLWSSFSIQPVEVEPVQLEDQRSAQQLHGFDLRGYDMDPRRKGTLLKNCVHPDLGLHILKAAANQDRQTLEAFMG